MGGLAGDFPSAQLPAKRLLCGTNHGTRAMPKGCDLHGDVMVPPDKAGHSVAEQANGPDFQKRVSR